MARGLLDPRAMTTQRITLFLLVSAALIGCADNGSMDGADDGTVSGQARYADANSKSDGTARAPARPNGATMDLTVQVEGTGQIDGLDSQCALDGATGHFTGVLQSSSMVDGDGAYLAALASGDAVFSTDGGCAIPQLDITALTGVHVRAAISATAPQCDSYCAADARSRAEADCGAEPSSAGCRSDAQATYTASCTTTCNGNRTDAVVADVNLSAAEIAELEAGSVGGTTIGDVQAELVFDHMEDASGEPVDY